VPAKLERGEQITKEAFTAHLGCTSSAWMQLRVVRVVQLSISTEDIINEDCKGNQQRFNTLPTVLNMPHISKLEFLRRLSTELEPAQATEMQSSEEAADHRNAGNGMKKCLPSA